ncbi:MAG: nicotinamide-nucleotide adenylyltransferase [Promethearchaeia archaeon]
MKEEILACIKKGDVKYLESGQVSKYIFPMERKKAHENSVSHLIVRIFIVTYQNDDILYLVQKRGDQKKSYPGYYTDSASGHVEYQEGLDMHAIKNNALRELKEEFGITKENLTALKFYDLQYEKDPFSQEIAYIFFGLVNPDVKPKPDPSELNPEKSIFYTESQLREILQKKHLVDYSEEIWNDLLEMDIKSFFEEEELVNTENRQATALFLGRFQPLHKGHLFVIKTLAEKYHSLKIGIGSSQFSHTQHNPFTKYERKQFLKECLEKLGISEERYHIYFIPDLFNAKKWVDKVINIVGNFDIVVSNSDWVRSLFEQKEYSLADKILFKKEIYNGTRIRKLIINKEKQWKELVPQCVLDLIKKYQGVERIRSDYRVEKI